MIFRHQPSSYAIALSLAVLVLPNVCSAQGYLSAAMTRQLGLTRMWQTQVDFDRGRGRLAGVHLHVSPTRLYSVFELNHQGRQYRFSELDLDAYGVKIGAAEARQKALDKLAMIKAELAAANDKTPPPQLISHVVPEITIYASSERGTLQAIDGETGRSRWAVALGNPNYPTTAPGSNNDYVAVVNGSRLFVLKASDGTIAFERRITGAPSAGPGVTAEFIYVPNVTGAVEVFEIEKPTYPSKTFYSNGRTLLQPLATERTAAWTTDEGVIYSANGRVPGMRFRLTMPGGCNTPPAILYPDRLIAASDNGHLYCMHEARGTVLWRISTGEAIEQPPFAVNNMAFLITDNGGLFAVDGDSGKEKWWINGITGFLAATKEHLYMSDTTGNVVMINMATGAKQGSIPAPGLDFRFQNMLTDRILLGTSTGSLQMYREVSRDFPLVHRGEEITRPKIDNVKAAVAGNGEVQEPMALGEPIENDPFGAAEPANDPFGAGPAPAPMPMPAAGEDPFDPFK